MAPDNANVACTNGACTYVCNPGWSNCNDTVATDGCQQAVSVSYCSACYADNGCGANQVCENGFLGSSAVCVQSNVWQLVNTGLGSGTIGSAVSVAITPSGGSPLTVYVSTAGNGIYALQIGSNWVNASSPSTAGAIAGLPNGSGGLVSVSATPFVDVTTTGGSASMSWSSIENPPADAIAAWAVVGGFGAVGASSNGTAAVAFQSQASMMVVGAKAFIESGTIGSGAGTGIAFGGGTTPHGIFYVSVNNGSGSGGGVYVSTNYAGPTGTKPPGGSTYSTTGFPHTDVQSIATDLNTTSVTIYAGTGSEGLYASENGSATGSANWTAIGSGIGNANIQAIAVDAFDNVFVGTPSGLYLCDAQGSASACSQSTTSWTLSGLSGLSVTSLAIVPGGTASEEIIYAIANGDLYVFFGQ
jgi:hypothetical protein